MGSDNLADRAKNLLEQKRISKVSRDGYASGWKKSAGIIIAIAILGFSFVGYAEHRMDDFDRRLAFIEGKISAND